MPQEYLCKKKDKRLLVLFTLGVVILFLNLKPSILQENNSKTTTWIELGGTNTTFVRTSGAVNLSAIETGQILMPILAKPDNIDLEEGRLLALIHSTAGQLSVAHASPRLAFLLGQPFSVNMASVEDLQLINGIGPSLAGKIIAYRESHGPIKNSYQLQSINGIGPKTSEKLTKHLTFTTEGGSDS